MLLSGGLVLLFLTQCSANSINDGPLSRWADLLFDDIPPNLRCHCEPTGDPNGSLSCKCHEPHADHGPDATPAAGDSNVPPNLRCHCGPLPGDTTGALACQCHRPSTESGGAPVTPGGAGPIDAGPVQKKTDNPTPQFDVVTPSGPIAPGPPPPGPGPNVGTPPPPPGPGPVDHGPGPVAPGPGPVAPPHHVAPTDNQSPDASGPVSAPADDDSSGETWTYVVCARRRAGLGKPYWEWLYDHNDDYFTVTGKWMKQQCAYGGVDPFLISRTIFSTIIRQCRYKGYETAQPANGLHSYWYPFQVDLHLTEYFREKTWFSFERYPQTPVAKC